MLLSPKILSRSKYIPNFVYLSTEKDDNPAIVEWIVKPLFLRAPLKDMAVMEAYLEEQDEDIRYTVVKPPQLTDGVITSE